ncbi:NACHT domain-containing protein [Dactylosporangium sp. CA-092794]|uniref:NACHT domain-containing protein n=1 Tax=Dactylosporangium sp. CA-092794 TaxID=3239929 RepID=UPI003D948467
MTLFEEATSYLRAEGYSIGTTDARTGLVKAEKAGIGGMNDQITVWCPPYGEPEELRRNEGGMLHRFKEDSRTGGLKFLLLESTQGLSAGFRQQVLSSYDVQTRVPIQFFDTPFRWDGAAAQQQAATAARKLHGEGEQAARSRTPQPFERVSRGQEGPDLLGELQRRFGGSAEWDRPIILVTAPAGSGKSMLFKSLFAALHTQFLAGKRQQRRGRRPLPLLPEYLSTASAPALRPMVEAFMQTEFARSTNPATFEWMLTRGYASWLLDGLDEVISRDPRFFEYIDDIINRDGHPRILICVRDSLLGSSPGLRDYLADASDRIDEYRLVPWQRESVVTFARIRLQDRDERLISLVDSRPKLLELCGTPYYAELLATHVAEDPVGELPGDYSELALIEDATRSIIRREYDKGLLTSAIDMEDLLDLVTEVAVEELRDVRDRGVDVAYIDELAALFLSELDDEVRERIAGQIRQLSLLRGALELNRVRFAQDVIFEYFIGVRAIAYFQANPTMFQQLLGWRRFPPDSIALRLLRTWITQHNAGEDLLMRLTQAADHDVAFHNMLQTLIGLPRCAALLQEAPLERRDLSGLVFSAIPLREVSLRGANLEATKFVDCDLTGCNLADAILSETVFTGTSRESLPRADFGDLARFVSVRLDRKTVDSADAFVRLIVEQGGHARSVDPCASAQQLTGLFLKFVRPNGQARRDWLDTKAVLAGKRHIDDPSVVVNAAVHAGFIMPGSGRARYERTHSELYADMVAYVRDQRMAPSITALLAEICREPDCAHASAATG